LEPAERWAVEGAANPRRDAKTVLKSRMVAFGANTSRVGAEKYTTVDGEVEPEGPLVPKVKL
jgi:hypothetical protein